jgi:hypothetical protein
MYDEKTCCAVTERRPEVHDATNAVDNIATNLMQLVDSLDKKLVAVLREAGPTACQQPDTPPAMVPLARSLSDSCHKLTFCVNGIESILGRLEV